MLTDSMQKAKVKRDAATERHYRRDRERWLVRAQVPGISYTVIQLEPPGLCHHVIAKTCDEAMTEIYNRFPRRTI